ncbi:phosphatidylserine decarboxylase family protein [Limibacter armeniacum]|uniref:phosphatidylserine decarboxylase family protein n=1 Tax=Limibacter armeniacum TaxID=466084 RepID=UPI002FE6C0CF
MTIHREGYKMLLVLVTLLTVVNVAMRQVMPEMTILNDVVLAVSVVFFLLILQFFRNPIIRTAVNPNQIISSVDGKVVVIEEVEETEYFKDKRLQISVFMSPLNVHVNRNPVSGIVKYFKYHPGKYLVAWHPKSSTENERTTVVIENEAGVEVLFRQIAGALAKRIRWYIKEGDQVEQGKEFGFIKFGSRVDIFLPLNADVKVKIGDKTKGGKTVLAELS